MAKPSSPAASSLILESPAIQIKNMSEEDLHETIQMLNGLRGFVQIPDDCNTEGFYSDISRSHLRQLSLERGRITYLLIVKPVVSNIYGFLHGGFVAAAAEFSSIACARTVLGEDKALFLGELSISYLSGAPQNAEVVVDASVLRSGKSLTIISIEFRLQKTGKLVYTARSTLYSMPMPKL
ncbi:acyl-coenzyme A thioesterase 13-like [Cucurbita pepo subsp. pepo]|uniref:acyl-coenzyme A thioesterase 13-like n=1 Tax=Cucurbita pepo subsp. pepo TaxID=3664 RepID=UPI000C9D88D6|nr:acyl-coenzyme A thioesterase 13-like [Cucurbita pepo subsp. pepo]